MNGLTKPVELKRLGQTKMIQVVLPQLHDENVESCPYALLQTYRFLNSTQIKEPDCGTHLIMSGALYLFDY